MSHTQCFRHSSFGEHPTKRPPSFLVLLDDTEQAVIDLLEFTRQLDITVIVGAPVAVGALLLNCALVIQQGKLLGIVAKTFLPNYSEFYEKRWFASSQDLRPQHILFAGNNIRVTPELQIFRTSEGATFAIEICEDVWAPTPPSNHLALFFITFSQSMRCKQAQNSRISDRNAFVFQHAPSCESICKRK